MASNTDRPLVVSKGHATAIGAAGDLRATNYEPEFTGAARLTISTDTGSVVSLRADNGTDQVVTPINGGVALTANQLYAFSLGDMGPVPTNEGPGAADRVSYNVVMTTGGNVTWTWTHIQGNES